MISSFPDTYINMKKLLSLPPNLVNSFHKIAKVNVDEWFCTSDPVGARLGSGGGTTWLIEACRQNEAPQISVKEWLAKEKRILLHAGGQSRRLPGYAPSGKILTPIPVFRWARGQKLSQNLLSLQLPLYEEIMYKAPDSLHTLIASGDVYIRNSEPLQDIPEVDVVCYGLWVDPALATNHGVFVSDRQTPDKLDFMLQKPSLDDLGKLAQTHLFLMDIGVWLLSDRAMELLMKHSYTADRKTMKSYDLYSEFGLALGEHPRIADTELNQLSVAILPLEGGEFYHYGTSRELISSTLAVQNLVRDQRAIMHRKVKPHPAMFVQNAAIDLTLTAENSELWIENSYIGKNWKLDNRHILTGVPANNWELDLPSGVCIDVVPVGEQDWAARPYGFNDPFKGASDDEKTLFMGCPVIQWGKDRGVTFEPFDDLQNAPLFPVCKNTDELGLVIRWMVSEPGLENGRKIWETSQKMSANELSDYANLDRLREGLIGSVSREKQSPFLNVYRDQIVWGRSPVRIDLAGGWTDTPPYCMYAGGNVVNVAIELNGQPPLQVYVKPSKEYKIILRSIDLGAMEVVSTWDELHDYKKIGSPFSIPKAALALAGFVPEFSAEHYPSLEDQLKSFGCGLEVTLLAAIPAGSGLGTSSILAATVLGAISDFCGLAWDKSKIGYRTLILEQLLTTGGGWQDQYGGVLHGLKLLQTGEGFNQNPSVRWLPEYLFTDSQYQGCHLLYYTGITRTAKNILAEIVQGMFLNSGTHLHLLSEMKTHALDMFEAIQCGNFETYGKLIAKTWEQKKALDSGTHPPVVVALLTQLKESAVGYNLPGAGGGGSLYSVAKDPDAALQIRRQLTASPHNPNARFVEMSLSDKGLQISRS